MEWHKSSACTCLSQCCNPVKLLQIWVPVPYGRLSKQMLPCELACGQDGLSSYQIS